MNDHYKTLGIKPEASQSEIKRAFRRLAKKYHPDVNASEDADMRFKEVSFAYGVLSCPKSRNEFDKTFSRKVCSGQSQGSSQSAIVEETCDECDRLGIVFKVCKLCSGKGSWVEKVKYGKTYVNSKIVCTICSGMGKITSACISCAGTGKVKKIVT